MDMKQDIRVVGLDLDSTLLKDDKTISDYTKNVLEKAIKRGIYIMPATGRVMNAIPDCVRAIEGIKYAVCSNGAAVVDLETGEEFYSAKMPLEQAFELFDILESYGTMVDCYIDGGGYTERRFYDHLDDFKMDPEIKKMVLSTREPVDDIRKKMLELNCPVEKINMFFADMEERAKAIDEISQIPYIKVTSSLRNNIEINARDCNKGAALLGFGEKMGFSREQIMCCGDGNNDYDMICMCGVGVAMENAVPRLKEAADYITYSNEEDGVAKAIERLCIRMRED